MANLDVKIEQTRQRLLDLQSQARKLKRKNDTRRKVLYGVAILALLDDLEPEQQKRTLKRLEEKIHNAADRKFLEIYLPSVDFQARDKVSRDHVNSQLNISQSGCCMRENAPSQTEVAVISGA